jgi:hypothetical protein
MVESAATVEGATAHTGAAARNTCSGREDLTAATHSTSGRRAAHVPASHMATAAHVAAATATHVAAATAAVAAATPLSQRRRNAKRQRARQSDGRHE